MPGFVGKKHLAARRAGEKHLADGLARARGGLRCVCRWGTVGRGCQSVVMMAILGDIAVVVVLLSFLLLLKKNMKFYFDFTSKKVLLKGKAQYVGTPCTD